MIIKKSSLAKGLPKATESLCPECRRVINAKIFEREGKVMIGKNCPDHGYFEDIYWSDVDMFLKAEKFAWDGIGLDNPQLEAKNECPNDCGLCTTHLTHTALGIVDLTNRCNLRCPICFANSNAAGYLYEPSFEQITDMMKLLRENEPVPCPAIQFSGGEPTIHPDFLKIVRKAKELGFSQIQVATNGLTLPQIAQEMVEAGLHVVYLQFDGLKEENYIETRGKPLLKKKLEAIGACRECDPQPQIVLVPTVIGGVNDGEVADILKFAIENRDVVRGVNYQPVSFCGRISVEERMEKRFTTSDIALKLAEQTDFLSKDDFYPVPAVAPLSELLSLITKEPKVAFTVHPHCGIATYLFHGEDGEIVPITRFVDVEGLLEEALKLAEEIESKGKGGILKALRLLKYIDKKKVPKEINVNKLLTSLLIKSDKKSLGDIHYRSTFIGCMHFQDEYNYDLERVKRCAIHYPTIDGRIIPFCAYNAGPTFREEIEEKYRKPLERIAK
jgi:hypothetical protein